MTMTTPFIRSLQVGLPRTLGTEGAADPMDRAWTTGYLKDPVPGPIWLGVEGLAGDGVADRRVHGGPEKAVLAYSTRHYPDWEAILGHSLPFGAFGENFSVEGLSEAEVCLGDRYAVGDALIEVSQPRQPCWKLARRWRVPDLAARVQESGRTGWYYRVRREGRVGPGDALLLIERPYPEWTVERANAVMRGVPAESAAAMALADCPALSASWRKTLESRIAGVPIDATARLVGPNAPDSPPKA
jgi:MOSC domain-containing protein YiiM